MPIRKIDITVGHLPGEEAVMKSYPFYDLRTYLMPLYTLTVAGTDEKGAIEQREFEVLRFGIKRDTAKSAPMVVGLANTQIHTIKAWLPSYNVHSATSLELGAWRVYDNFLIHDGPDYPQSEKFGSIGCVEICGTGGFITFCDFIDSISGADGPDQTARLTAIAMSGRMSIKYQGAMRPPLKFRGP